MGMYCRSTKTESGHALSYMLRLFSTGFVIPRNTTTVLNKVKPEDVQALLLSGQRLHILLPLIHAQFNVALFAICTLTIVGGRVTCEYHFDTYPFGYRAFENVPLLIPTVTQK